MEWLMEEVDVPDSASSSHHRSNHSNGHIRTKRVNTDALRPFPMDEQEDDSEDEVLSIPGVRVHKPSRSAAAQRSAFLQVSLICVVLAALPHPDANGVLISGGERRRSGRPPGGLGWEE